MSGRQETREEGRGRGRGSEKCGISEALRRVGDQQAGRAR